VSKGQVHSPPRDLHVPVASVISDADISIKCAYATMVINNAEYLSGAFTLAWSLKTCGSKADRVLIVDQAIHDEFGEIIELTELFSFVFVIPDKLEYKAIQRRWKKYEQSGMYDWIDTAFNKYYCFVLSQYSRVIMLDADQICLQSPDELFKLHCPAGICSYYKEEDTAKQRRQHGHKVPNGDVRRAYEREWGMRGCLFMVEPGTNTFNDIQEKLEMLQKGQGGVGNTKCHLGADEKFLTQYYMTTQGDSADSDWTHIDAKFSRLSYIDKTALPDEPYFLHFCTFKPWRAPGDDKWIHERWEDIAIWVFASTSTAMQIMKGLSPQQILKHTQKINQIMTPDAKFYGDVLNQEWTKKYIDFAKTTEDPQNTLLDLYRLMTRSYRKMQAQKASHSHDLQQRMRNLNVQENRDHNARSAVQQQQQSNDVRATNLNQAAAEFVPATTSFGAPQQDVRNLAEWDSKPMDMPTAPKPLPNPHVQRQKSEPLWSFDYSPHLLLSALLSESAVKVPDKVIWQFWNSAEQEMPRVIACCVDSVRKNNPNWRHILVTPQNIEQYLDLSELPANLLKFDKAAHISDVVRVALLAKYGGIYCDATTVCFKKGQHLSFDYIWDTLLMRQGFDFVGFRYDESTGQRWKNDEKFCCWFMATKKDSGLFHAWLGRIKQLMKGKTSNAALDVIDAIWPNDAKKNAFRKYVALGPGILDGLFEEYRHYHSNFRFMLYDPRQANVLLDPLFSHEQLWYLRRNEEFGFRRWQELKKPCFIKLFAAAKGKEMLYREIAQAKGYKDHAQVTLKDILQSGKILSDILQLV